jgi:MFS family permease
MSLEVFKALLSLSYWFSYYPGAFSGFIFWLVLGLSAAGVVIGIILFATSSLFKDLSSRRIVKRLGKLSIVSGILGLVSFFFTQTNTPLLGSRFWFLLWLITGIVWFIFILRYAFKVVPREREARERNQIYSKYLPRSR